jgi:nitrite reductase/ring-hydroxylating ferredoxin subunit/uncharacterized membrane protein
MALTAERRGLGELVERGIGRQRDWLDPLAERVQGWLSKALERGGPDSRRVKDALNGAWFGHPLHPALTDAPIGAWVTTALLDLTGPRKGADATLTFGILAALPAAAAGLADWHDQSGPTRRTGLLHAIFNGGGLLLFVSSLLARRNGHRGLGVTLSTGGLALTSAGAYLGGELVYRQGTGVDRNAWTTVPTDWQVAAKAVDLVDGQLAAGQITVDGTKLPLVLLKRGEEILALGGSCSHLGGPLAEGRLVEATCVVCPWHGSQFDLRDGRIVHGPATAPQPVYEARLWRGNIEVRAANVEAETR